MAKFKVVLKLQALELEIEGSRDDVPLIAHSVGQQVAGMLQPAARIVSGDDKDSQPPTAPASPSYTPPKRKSRRVRPAAQAQDKGQQGDTIDWVHNPQRWGSPQQTWSTANKALWLLYVVLEEKQLSELSSSQIATTFNKHFKQARTIRHNNVSRDLGRLKTGADAAVGENTTETPSRWFLTDSGKRAATKLVEEALGRSTSGE